MEHRLSHSYQLKITNAFDVKLARVLLKAILKCELSNKDSQNELVSFMVTAMLRSHDRPNTTHFISFSDTHFY